MNEINTSFPIQIEQNFIVIRMYKKSVDSYTLLYKSKHGNDHGQITSFPNNNIYTFCIRCTESDSKYYYYIKCTEVRGKFKTLADSDKIKKNVSFNMLSCIGHGFNSENFNEFVILPKKKSNFNLLLGDNIYADQY